MGLVKCGGHHFFANAVQYPGVRAFILSYINLAMNKWEWYTDLKAEDCAMPSTFAVFALGLLDEKYFDIIIKYMETVDSEHQSIQGKFTPAFVEKFGITPTSIDVYIKCIMSMQEHPYYKIFADHLSDERSLNLLLACKNKFTNYLMPKDGNKEEENNSNKRAGYAWGKILYTTFGNRREYSKLISGAPDNLKEAYKKLMENE